MYASVEGDCTDEVATVSLVKHPYPKFKGSSASDDADSFVKIFESVSKINNEDYEGCRLRIFPSLLRKKAQRWYFRLLTSDPKGIDTWDKLRSKFTTRFREPGYEHLIWMKLRDLYRGKNESLQDYIDRFYSLLDRIPKGEPYSEPQAIDWFVTGLSTDMEIYCMRMKCDTLNDVLVSALAYETTSISRRGRRMKDSFRQRPKSSSNKKKEIREGNKKRKSVSSFSNAESSSKSGEAVSESSSSESQSARRKRREETVNHVSKSFANTSEMESQVAELVKEYEDLKVQVVELMDKRKTLDNQS